ncbi:MAG: alpha-2-macroglobulin, partial [Polaromonas sp.]|nr:alpha-2-macroglobulin [Polaromonas sp.]
MARIITRIIVALTAAVALQAHALQITSLSPQGEVAQIRQVVAKFDESAVNFGDPKAPAPLRLSCSDAQAAKGNGRWISDREWAFELASDLPAGVSCTVTPTPGFKSPSGAVLTSAASYKFNSGGPFVQDISPDPDNGEAIEEDQYFVLQLNGAATLASIQAKVWCVAEGLGERVPVKLIEGAERTALLAAKSLTKAAAAEPLKFVTLACNRRLTPATKLQLVYGKGVSTPGGIPNSVEKRFEFKVREPFLASFSCERENAQSGCLPIRPMTLSFNAPVPRKLAEAIRLKSSKDTLKPVFGNENGEGESLVSSAIFNPPLAEQTQYSLELPKDFKDGSDRPLANPDKFPLKVATSAMPPLAKFAASPFGIIERFAEPNGLALLPVTLRNVEAALQVKGLAPGASARPALPAGKVSDLQLQNDADIIAWLGKVARYQDGTVTRSDAAANVKGPLPKALDADSKDYLQARMVSLLNGRTDVKALDLPTPASGDPRPFEVVGIPLAPGFHVVEIASQKLGASLLDERYGASRTMYVRTSALVTNLGVHFKLGRENALAWVTTLDKGAPVAGAVVRVSDCKGKELAKATTDAKGIANFTGLSPEPPEYSGDSYQRAYFVSARAGSGDAQAQAQDLAFTWSDWHKGIEP